MKRRLVSRLLGASAFAALLPLAAQTHAQTAGKVPKIGLLLPFTEATTPIREAHEALLSGLRELGWVDGKTIEIELRWAGVDPKRQREVASELKALPVAMILASGTPAIRAAQEGAPGLPIVMINAGDPVGSGFVATLSRPGGKLTGTSAAGAEVLSKQLELLASIRPRPAHVNVLMNRANPANNFFFDAMSASAKALGMPLRRIDVGPPDELAPAVARAAGGALIVLGDPMFESQRERLVGYALSAKVPTMFGGRSYVATGGLMSYLSPRTEHFRAAARYVDKILKGANPGDLPVEQPTKFELVINLRTAKILGLTIPQSLLLRADEVIE